MKVEEKDFEPAGLIPRSIIRTVERFQQQLRPETIALGIQEFRISRYQVRVSVRYFFILLLLPITINWGTKNFIIKPLVEYFWNTYGTSLFLNSYQAERAFQEMRDFESQLFFEMLLSNEDHFSKDFLPSTQINTNALSCDLLCSQKNEDSTKLFSLPSDLLNRKPLLSTGPHLAVHAKHSMHSKKEPSAVLLDDFGCGLRPNTNHAKPKALAKAHNDPFWMLSAPLGRASQEGDMLREAKQNQSPWPFLVSSARPPQVNHLNSVWASKNIKEIPKYFRCDRQDQSQQGFHIILDSQNFHLDRFDFKTPSKNVKSLKPIKSQFFVVPTESIYKETFQNKTTKITTFPKEQDSNFFIRQKFQQESKMEGLRTSLIFRRDTEAKEFFLGPWSLWHHLGGVPVNVKDFSPRGMVLQSTAYSGPSRTDAYEHHPLFDAFCTTWPQIRHAPLAQSQVVSLGPKKDQHAIDFYKEIFEYYQQPGFVHLPLYQKSKNILEKEPILPLDFANKNLCSLSSINEYFLSNLVDKSNAPTIPKLDLCFTALFQQKTMLLAEIYNQQSITALSNMFGDCIMIVSIILLLRWNAPQFTILKSFLIESFYSFNDAIKCFYIILITDFLVGFHSPRGWEIAMEMLLRHLGLPENEEFILLFVGTFPVFLDTAFKYWIFRYLNKISPSTVATYHSMIE